MKRQALASLRGLLVACALLTYGCTTLTDPPRFEPPRISGVVPAGLKITTSLVEDAAPLQLLVDGMGPENELRPGELRIRALGAPALDATASIGFIFEDASRTSIGLSEYWELDQQDNSLVISAERMAQLVARLPRSQVNVMLGLADSAGAFAFGASFKALKRTPPKSTPT